MKGRPRADPKLSIFLIIEPRPTMSVLQLPADLPRLPRRHRETSKRDYGRVLVVGGSVGMAGAPALASQAALRSGAGLVEMVVPEVVVGIAAAFDPCVMTRGLAAGGDGTFAATALDAIRERAGLADAVAVGPGLGRSAATRALVLALWRDLPQPAVFDADALWALAHAERRELAAHAGPRILTPHAGEMLRLDHEEPSSPVASDRALLEGRAATLAAAIDAVVVLKGPGTLVVDRTARAHNETGNPGMATAGTGDVLTGIVAALVAQGLAPFDAARLAAWLHGRAGDLAAERVGEISLIATDLLASLPQAIANVVA
jgi:ADP-dependent NAD(P)H-hydrate dehydratase